MKGGEKARWVDEDMSDTFFGKAREYIVSNKDKPFFLYYAMHQPHVPRTPHPRFAGATDMGSRGDVIIEADAVIGDLLDLLKEEGIHENTMTIFSSDNGPVVNDGYKDESVERLGNHTPWGPFRGGKYSLFEAGTRVPFVVYWPGKIRPDVSDAMICQLDLFSSLAALVGHEQDYPDKDSENFIDVLLGKSDTGRDELILEATGRDRKSTRLNSSHVAISYAVFCLK